MVCDDGLTVKFTSNNWLRIVKKNKDQAGTVILTQRRWREEEAKLKHEQVKVVVLNKVNVGEACKDLFTFISTCTHCDRLVIVNVIDGREKNSELSCRLCEVLDRLHNLIQLDMLGPLCYKLITIVNCYLETDLTCFVYCLKALYLIIFIVWHLL